MSRTSRRIALFAACVAIGGLGFLVGNRGGPFPAHVRSDASDRQGDSQAGGASARPAAAGDAAAAPTGASSPAAESSRYSQLAHRADAGDRSAARELATLLDACAGIAEHERFRASVSQLLDPDYARERQHPIKPATVAKVQQSIDAANRTLREDHERCAGITAAEIASRAQWLYKAAMLGDTKSALEFGEGQFLDTDVFSQLDQVRFWREHAEAMLERALAGGEDRAALDFATAYDPGAQFQATSELRLAPDPVAAYAYYYVVSLLADVRYFDTEGSLARLGAELTPAERADAIALAARICTQDLPGSSCAAAPAKSH